MNAMKLCRECGSGYYVVDVIGGTNKCEICKSKEAIATYDVDRGDVYDNEREKSGGEQGVGDTGTGSVS